MGYIVRVLKHPICFISLFNLFSHVMMSDGNSAGNFGLTSGHYTTGDHDLPADRDVQISVFSTF